MCKDLCEKGGSGQYSDLFAFAEEESFTFDFAYNVTSIVERRCVFNQPSTNLRFPAGRKEMFKRIRWQRHCTVQKLLRTFHVSLLVMKVPNTVNHRLQQAAITSARLFNANIPPRSFMFIALNLSESPPIFYSMAGSVLRPLIRCMKTPQHI